MVVKKMPVALPICNFHPANLPQKSTAAKSAILSPLHESIVKVFFGYPLGLYLAHNNCLNAKHLHSYH